MSQYRYGKLRVRDFCLIWFACAFLFLLGCAAIVLDIMGFLPSNTFFIGVFLIVFALGFFFSVLRRLKEQFSIDNGVLLILRYGKKMEQNLPPHLTVIISYADFLPPLATRSVESLYMKQSISLDGQYAITLIEGSWGQEIFPLLRQYRYSSSHIEEVFQDHYIYSFVCNQELFDNLISQKECNVIIPSSLANRLTVNNFVSHIFIDHTF